VNRLSSMTAAAVALLLTPAFAQAADLTRRPMPAPAVAPNWNGGYAGFNLGYGFGQSNWDPAPVGGSPSPKGFLGGITLGYNYQSAGWVWGLEADINYSSMKGSADCLLGTCQIKNSWLATERLRFGYAGWSGWLPYLTAGLAEGDVKLTTPSGAASSSKIGWAGGLGVEYLMGTNWTLKAEYLYVSLGSVSCDALCGETASFKANLLRTGVNYRF
jgi:outer membrane immunogenic protein